MSGRLGNVIAGGPDGRDFSESDILVQLQRITDSKVFAGSPRLCRFLVWTVKQTLHDGGEGIKQYAVGREVFDRKDDFDPRVDSIVRTEAQRLRRKLREYYESSGSSDPVVISFGSGSYVARFKKFDPPQTIGERPRQAVAVLPFENLTANPELDFFCRGMTEGVQERLASARKLKIISSDSAFRFGVGSDFSLVASRLGVTAIVQGSIQQISERIRVRVKAIDLASGSYIWAQAFDRQMRDVFAVEDEIAFSVADALTVQLLGDRKDSNLSPPPIEAYKLYLQGRHHWNQLSPEHCEKALDCFTRAILLFPEYAQPYAALAEAYLWLIYFSTRAAGELVEVARGAALQAIRLDPKCAEAYVALGSVTGAFDFQWEESERLFRQGLELRPNYVPGYIQRAFVRAQAGDLEGARLDQEVALELDPLSPRCYRLIAVRLYLQRDYESALIAIERALQLGPEVKHSYYLRGLIELQAGRYKQAIISLRESIEDSAPGLYRGALVAAYAMGGFMPEATEVLRTLHERAKHSFVSPIAFVHAYTGMDAKSEALDWLAKAADGRYIGLMCLETDPFFDSLRAEARFLSVLERMHLPSATRLPSA